MPSTELRDVPRTVYYEVISKQLFKEEIILPSVLQPLVWPIKKFFYVERNINMPRKFLIGKPYVPVSVFK